MRAALFLDRPEDLTGLAPVPDGPQIEPVVSEVPEVLKSGFYASASILGALAYFCMYQFQLFQENSTLLMFSTVAFIVVVRMLALKMNFRLKKLHKMSKSPTALSQERRKKM